MLQAPVLGYRRGRGVLDSRDPLSVTLPLGRDLWGEADVVPVVGSRLLIQLREWGVDRELAIIRVGSDAKEHDRLHKPAVTLTGDAKPILQRLVAELPAHNTKRPSRTAEMQERQAAWRKRLEKLAPRLVSGSDPCRTAGGRHFCRRSHPARFCRAPRLSGLQAAHFSLAWLSGQSRLGLCDGTRCATGPARRAGGGDIRRRRLSVHRQ